MDRAPESLAAQIAARYGATVAPGVTVQQIPRGASGIPQPVWDGRHLVYPDLKGTCGGNWRGKRHKAQGEGRQTGAPARAAGEANRAEVLRLHGRGLTDAQIAAASGLSVLTVGIHRRACGLPANRDRSAAERRLARLREVISAGYDDQDAAADLGLSPKRVRQIAREAGLTLPRRAPMGRKPGVKSGGKLGRAPRSATAKPPAAPRLQISDDEARTRKAQAQRAAWYRRQGREVPKISATERAAERRQAVARDHANGLSVCEIAARLGVSRQTVWAALKALGLSPVAAPRPAREKAVTAARPAREKPEMAPAHAARRRKSADLKARVVQAHDAGQTVEAIATAEEITPNWVARILRAEGRAPSYASERAMAARLQEVIDRAARGETGPQIAAAVGMPLAGLYQLCSRKGVSLARNRLPPHNAGDVSPEVAARRAEVARLRGEGLTLRDMVARLGVSQSTLSSDITALGLGGASAYHKARGSLAQRRPDLMTRAVDLALQGQGRAEIARRLALRPYQVTRLLRAAAKLDAPPALPPAPPAAERHAA